MLIVEINVRVKYFTESYNDNDNCNINSATSIMILPFNDSVAL